MAIKPPQPWNIRDWSEYLSELHQDDARDGYENMGSNNSFFHSGSISQYVNGQQGNTGQGGGAAGTAGAYCAQTVPAGPPILTGSEIIPMDTGLAGGAPPQTVVIPSTLLANGYGSTTVATTTGTTAAVQASDGISNYIYAGAGTATYTSFKLPPDPIQNQKFCLINAGSGALTLTSVAVGTSGQSIVGGAAPASLVVQTTNSAAAQISTVCYLYNVSNTSWYRVS